MVAGSHLDAPTSLQSAQGATRFLAISSLSFEFWEPTCRQAPWQDMARCDPCLKYLKMQCCNSMFTTFTVSKTRPAQLRFPHVSSLIRHSTGASDMHGASSAAPGVAIWFAAKSVSIFFHFFLLMDLFLWIVWIVWIVLQAKRESLLANLPLVL